MWVYMAGITRIPRSRGVLSGLLLILLGAWGALIPFVGPYFHYAFTPARAWDYTTGRLWLEILPGVAVALGGFIVLASVRRPLAMFGAFLAALGGAWFVIGNLMSSLWNGSVPEAGVPVGTTLTRLALEELGFFLGLGVVIVFFAALALGRCSVVGVKDAALAERAGGAVPADAFAGTAASPFAGSSAAAGLSTSPFEHQEETVVPSGGSFTGARDDFTGAHDESPTVTGRFPPAENSIPAERDPFTPEPGSLSPGTGQFPPAPGSGTATQA
jgi:hypothetical protein